MSDSATPQRKNKRDRKATEESILKAFESVLLREGVRGLGVNAVANEAGVNKVLIYRYFGDFAGLARQWAESGSFWPAERELIGMEPDEFAKLEVRDRVIEVLCNYMDSIRARPRTVEMMAGELTSPNEVTRALADGMARPGKGVSDFIQLETADQDLEERVWKLIYVINAMTSFMAIRERNNPNYLGFDLSQDESWTFLRDTVADIAANYLKD